MSGSVYKITCIPTGKVYVGQTTDVKFKNGKPYNYGPDGRWSDHVSSSKKTNTPLSQAIQEYGRDKFTIEILETDLLEKLDELEAKWINKLKCIVPDGLNVVRHSRNKHHSVTTLQEHFKGKVETISLRPIKNKGEYKLVYLILTLKDGEKRRITFGQDGKIGFEEALENANEFAKGLECPLVKENFTSEKVGDRMKTKLAEINKKEICKIRITTASSLIAVYIRSSDMKSYKDEIRICFGGKKIPVEIAYDNALEFVELINKTADCTIEDSTPKKSATGGHM